MNDVLLVGRIERRDHLPGDVHRRRAGESASGHGRTPQPLIERFTIDEFHRQGDDAVLPFEAVDGSDVRMAERGENPRLALESCDSLRIRDEHRRQRLERNVAAEPKVVGPVHLAHPADTDQRKNLVRTDLVAKLQCQCGRRITSAGWDYANGVSESPELEPSFASAPLKGSRPDGSTRVN